MDSVITNDGTIAGGNGYFGGTGVYLDGGTLINDGAIDGGSAHSSRADAVMFGAGGAGKLIVDPAASFLGQVAGNSGATDTLELGGSVVGSFSGAGQPVCGFC